MVVRKFCLCDVKLERDVADEEIARQVWARFRLEHSGAGHGPISGNQYLKLIQSIIKRKAASKGKADSNPRLRMFQVIKGGK